MANRNTNFNVVRYEHKGREFVRLTAYSNNSEHVQTITMTPADALHLRRQLDKVWNAELVELVEEYDI